MQLLRLHLALCHLPVVSFPVLMTLGTVRRGSSAVRLLSRVLCVPGCQLGLRACLAV